MAASVTDFAEITQEELDAMAWHPSESLQGHCCIKVEMLKNFQQQHKQTEQSMALCNLPAQCILCAGLAHMDKTMKGAYEDSENLKVILEGALNDPTCLLQSIEDNTTWQDFYINAMQYLGNQKLLRKRLSHLGARSLPLSEVRAVAASRGLQQSSILVEIRSMQTLRESQYMVRITKDMGNWLYGQWHIATFPEAHQRFTLHLNTEHIGDVTEAVLGIAWLVQFVKIPKLQKWVLLSQQMQASLETYAATATKNYKDAEIATFHGSNSSGSVLDQDLFSRCQVFTHSRQEQTSFIAEQTPAIKREEDSTSVAVASSAAVEAATLSSLKYVQAGSFVIAREHMPKYKRRFAQLDRHMKTARTDLATIRRAFNVESDDSDASCSGDIAKVNRLGFYIKQGLIIQWNLTEPSVAKYFTKFGDEAKVNWSVSQFTEFVANKVHEQLPKLKEVITKAETILRYARPRHAGPMHDYFVPFQTLISSVQAALDMADLINTSQLASLAAHHKDNKGTHIFQLALVEVPEPEQKDNMVLYAFIRANPSLVQHMGISCLGQVLPDKQKMAQLEEDQQLQEQHWPQRKREATQQQDQAWERWNQGSSSWRRRGEQRYGGKWNDKC